MGVYIYTEEQEWQPGDNTLAYFPFENDQLDKSGNGHTITGTGTKQTLGFEFTTGSGAEIQTTCSSSDVARFTSYWINVASVSSVAATQTVMIHGGAMRYFWEHKDYSSQAHKFVYFITSSSNTFSNTVNLGLNSWHHLAYGCDSNNNYYAWADGVLVWSGTASGQRLISGNILFQGQNTTATYSDYIVEKQVWSNDDVVAYYNLTKTNYGL